MLSQTVVAHGRRGVRQWLPFLNSWSPTCFSQSVRLRFGSTQEPKISLGSYSLVSQGSAAVPTGPLWDTIVLRDAGERLVRKLHFLAVWGWGNGIHACRSSCSVILPEGLANPKELSLMTLPPAFKDQEICLCLTNGGTEAEKA